jgi:hypothetical protein
MFIFAMLWEYSRNIGAYENLPERTTNPQVRELKSTGIADKFNNYSLLQNPPRSVVICSREYSKNLRAN